MEITVHSSKSVKPDYGDRSDGGALAASTDVVQLSVFDKVSFDEYSTAVWAFHPRAPPNSVLEAGLARALAVYREWAGRLAVDDGVSGNRAIMLNDAGARYVEAMADGEFTRGVVSELTTGADLLGRLHPSCAGAEELLLAQVTRFRCGAITIAVSMHHRVADGHGKLPFLFAWGQAARGGAIDPVPVQHDRSSCFAPRDPPQVMFEHRGNEFKPRGEASPAAESSNGARAGGEVVTHRVHFSKERIMDLKSQASSEGARKPCTTVQCVSAHLWRCITAARGLDGDAVTRMRVAVNGRTRMKNPRVPAGYTGNVVLWAWPAATARELLAQPIRAAVELISRSVARIDDAYFRSFVDFASSGVVEEEGLVPTADALELTLSPDVEVDSLLGMPFYEMDFGGGARPFFFMPGDSMTEPQVDGFVYVVQSFEGDGSVDAYVSLFGRTIDAFKKCCYSLQPMADERSKL